MDLYAAPNVSKGSRLCENSRVQFARRKFFSIGESENKNAGDGYPMKAIEKLVLPFLGSHTFSHGLDPLQTLGAVDSNAGPCPTPARTGWSAAGGEERPFTLDAGATR